MPHSRSVQRRSRGPIQQIQAAAKQYATNALKAYAYSSLPYPAAHLAAQQAQWFVSKALSIRKGKSNRRVKYSRGGATGQFPYYSSFNYWKDNFRMPYRRRYRRSFRGRRRRNFGNRRFGRRRRFNKSRRRYQRINWRKGAFHGVGPQCMPTHAFCKLKRKFAGRKIFTAAADVRLIQTFMSHDLSRTGYGMEPNATVLDFFKDVDYTTPHAITYLLDSFNVVRCFKTQISISFMVTPIANMGSDAGFQPIVFTVTSFDKDAATTDHPVATTTLHDAMLDQRSQMKVARPWYAFDSDNAKDFWTGFSTPSSIKFKATILVPKAMENAKVKDYFLDDDYANKITGSLGSRAVATPVKSGEVRMEIGAYRLNGLAFAATGINSGLSVQCMGSVTQYTTWSKPNNALRFKD